MNIKLLNSEILSVTTGAGGILAVPNSSANSVFALTSDLTSKADLTALNEVSSDLIDSLSNDINPKISAIADLVSANIETLDQKADVSSLATVATTGSYTDLSNKPDINEDVYLDYATVTSLSLVQSTDVYRMTLTANGVSATFPTIDPTSIPNRNAYYRFELEIGIPAGVTTITYPNCYEWLDEDNVPEPSAVEGKTMYLACRFDCIHNRSNLSGSVLANVWRIA